MSEDSAVPVHMINLEAEKAPAEEIQETSRQSATNSSLGGGKMDMFVVNKNSKGTEIEKMEVDLFEILLYLNGTRGMFRVRL